MCFAAPEKFRANRHYTTSEKEAKYVNSIETKLKVLREALVTAEGESPTAKKRKRADVRKGRAKAKKDLEVSLPVRQLKNDDIVVRGVEKEVKPVCPS